MAACESALETDVAQLAADDFGVPAFWLWARGEWWRRHHEPVHGIGHGDGHGLRRPERHTGEAAIREQASALADIVLTRI